MRFATLWIVTLTLLSCGPQNSESGSSFKSGSHNIKVMLTKQLGSQRALLVASPNGATASICKLVGNNCNNQNSLRNSHVLNNRTIFSLDNFDANPEGSYRVTVNSRNNTKFIRTIKFSNANLRYKGFLLSGLANTRNGIFNSNRNLWDSARADVNKALLNRGFGISAVKNFSSDIRSYDLNSQVYPADINAVTQHQRSLNLRNDDHCFFYVTAPMLNNVLQAGVNGALINNNNLLRELISTCNSRTMILIASYCSLNGGIDYAIINEQLRQRSGQHIIIASNPNQINCQANGSYTRFDSCLVKELNDKTRNKTWRDLANNMSQCAAGIQYHIGSQVNNLEIKDVARDNSTTNSNNGSGPNKGIAKDLSIIDQNNKKLSLREISKEKRYFVINFTATKCPRCQEYSAKVKAFFKDTRNNKNCKVINIVSTAKNANEIKAFNAEKDSFGLTFAAENKQTLAQAGAKIDVKVSSTPFVAFFDSKTGKLLESTAATGLNFDSMIMNRGGTIDSPGGLTKCAK